MNETMTLAVTFLAGGVLGAVFFGGLWWTVCRGVVSERPVLWFITSLLLRLGLVLSGFYFVAGGQSGRLIVCLLGFLAARRLVTRLHRAAADRHARSSKEVSHAS